jgi:myosin-5
MNHMASLQRGPVEAGDEGVNPVVQRVVDSNPLLSLSVTPRPAVTTTHLVSVHSTQFDRDENAARCPLTKLAGSKCEVYLLEESRGLSHHETEDYHVMYQLCATTNERRFWFGKPVSRTPTTMVQDCWYTTEDTQD